MDYINVIGFLQNYSLPTVIISVLVAIICFTVDKFLTKPSFNLKNYIPFIAGITFFYIYSVIFTKSFEINTEICSSGLLCGSFGFGIFVFLKKIFTGSNDDVVKETVKGILSIYFEEKVLDEISTEIKGIVLDNNDNQNLNEKIVRVLLDYDSNINNEKAQSLASLIIKSVSLFV